MLKCTDLLQRVCALLDALLVSGARAFDLGQLLIEAHGHEHGASHEAQITQRGQERQARRVILRSRAPVLRRVVGLRAGERLVAIIRWRAVLVSVLCGHRSLRSDAQRAARCVRVVSVGQTRAALIPLRTELLEEPALVVHKLARVQFRDPR